MVTQRTQPGARTGSPETPDSRWPPGNPSAPPSQSVSNDTETKRTGEHDDGTGDGPEGILSKRRKGSRALIKAGLDTAWQRFAISALKEGVLTPEQPFGMHDLKRKGITDTKGTQVDKQQASGHKDEAMMDVYDLSVPTVKPSAE